MSKRFYVYEWYNVDTEYVFYVGKGRGNRCYNIKSRTKEFKEYHNNHKCDVRKVKFGMKEENALDLEIKLIKKYRKVDQCCCNFMIKRGVESQKAKFNEKQRLILTLTTENGLDFLSDEYDSKYDDYTYYDFKEMEYSELMDMVIAYADYREGMATFNNLMEDEHFREWFNQD